MTSPRQFPETASQRRPERMALGTPPCLVALRRGEVFWVLAHGKTMIFPTKMVEIQWFMMIFPTQMGKIHGKSLEFDHFTSKKIGFHMDLTYQNGGLNQ